MVSSDQHLESSLREYNDRIDMLEKGDGTDADLMEAYINRGCVLSMMGYFTSAISDFDDAIDIATHLVASGVNIDTGFFVKAYVSRGELTNDADEMESYYKNAVKYLRSLKDGSRFYNTRSIVRMCLDVSEDLLDADRPFLVEEFTGKAWALLMNADDAWSRNMYVRMCELSAESRISTGDNEGAISAYDDCIRVSKELMTTGELSDIGILILAFSMRGDTKGDFDDVDGFIEDKSSALLIAEELLRDNRLTEPEIIADLHREISKAYLSKGMDKEAESHMIAALKAEIGGARGSLD